MQALALVESPDHVCCRYRIRAFEPALARSGIALDVIGLASSPVARTLQLARLPANDVVILQRKLLPGWQLRLLRRSSKRLIFDFDDAVLYRDSYDRRGPYCPRRRRRFGATVRVADLILAGNAFLAERAREAGAAPDRVRVIPTCVATDQYEPADRADALTSKLDLVWIGSSSTLKGLEQRRGLFDRIAREVPGVRLRVICDRFPDLGALPVVPVQWSQASEARELAAGDVGITWVPDDLWSRGKCGLKVLQYQAAGLPVVANPVGVHSEMIDPGRTGELATTDDEWVQAVRSLAANPARRAAMGRSARVNVESRYSVEAWETAFAGAVSGTGLVRQTPPRPKGFRGQAIGSGREGRDRIQG